MSSDLPDGVRDAEGDSEGETGESPDEAVYERFTIVQIGDHRLAIPVTAVGSVINRAVDVTRVPRSSPAVEGVTDIRGQITTLIDPHVHFPDSGGPSDAQTLLVFDDRDQPSAVHVDEVIGVEAVPEDGVFDQTTYEADEREGTALAHPLISGAIRVETRTGGTLVDSMVADEPTDDADDPVREAGLGRAQSTAEPDESGVIVGEFSLDEEAPDESTAADRDSSSDSAEVEVEITPILDVDAFLLASGRSVDDRDPVDRSTAE